MHFRTVYSNACVNKITNLGGAGMQLTGDGVKHYEASHRSGADVEHTVASILRKYNFPLWCNVRIPTMFTRNGTTETDIVFTDGERIFVVECKNVQTISGKYNDEEWTLTGASKGTPYTALNVMVQCNLHQHAFTDAYFEEYGEFPNIDAVIVVPNQCVISDDIREYIYTIEEFSSHIRNLPSAYGKLRYKIDALISKMAKLQEGVE